MTHEQMKADMLADMANMTREGKIEYLKMLALLLGITDIPQWLASILLPQAAETHDEHE